MELSRSSSKGQITIPKAIRERLNLREGDRVAFLEDNGKIIMTKASVMALWDVQDAIRQEAEAQGLTGEELLRELERVRKEQRGSGLS